MVVIAATAIWVADYYMDFDIPAVKSHALYQS